MKKIVLKVVKQCVATEGVDAAYVKNEILPPFFKHFWTRRMALDKRNYRKKILSFGFVEPTNEKETNVAHRAAELHRFNRAAYERWVESGYDFEV